jgi:SagB-type dehydrogenase family enzyme
MITTGTSTATVRLPAPRHSGGSPLVEALAKRRSIRDFTEKRLSMDQLAELCWAALGITDKARALRTAPSAGVVYPMRLFVADADGMYEYLAEDHSLQHYQHGDQRPELQAAALDQRCVGAAPACFVIAFDDALMQVEYGSRATRYCLLEAGHIAQNLLLQAVALGLGAVPVGAFDDDRIRRLLSPSRGLRPAYLVPVGYPAPPGLPWRSV